MTDQKPSLCRNVLYRAENGEDQAAIITKVYEEEGLVDLVVFPPASESYQPTGQGIGKVPFDETRDAHVPFGTWRWPERV